MGIFKVYNEKKEVRDEMLRKIVQICFLILGGTIGIFFIPPLFKLVSLDTVIWINNPYVSAIIGALIFYLITFWAIDHIVNIIKWMEDLLIKAPVTDIIFGSVGLISGLIVAFLAGLAINQMELPFIKSFVPIILTLILGYLGFQVGFKRRDELSHLFTTNRAAKKQVAVEPVTTEQGSNIKILDTSVIIDGRIADICQTGFLDGVIVIPQFVLAELQHIADSSDTLKRNRGRRGLDILNRLQKEIDIEVQMYEGDFEDIQEVDSKLIKLAKMLDGIVVTNDYNLNKVSEFQNVPVFNINALANAIKPVVIPGETMDVLVMKDGTERQQGVAYLDDGTMVVVEDGKHFMNKRINVIVTSALQTAAGRMIFAKPSHSQTTINN